MATTTPQILTGDIDQEKPQDLAPVSPRSLPATTCFREGVEYLGHGNAELAAACFEQVVTHSPDYADAHVGLGIAYALLLQIYPSIDHLERATQLEPDNFSAHFKLGQLYFKLRIPQKGYAESEQALACAVSLQERQLVAQLLKEEKAREKNGVPRPWWHKPFAGSVILLSATLAGVVCLALLLHLG